MTRDDANLQGYERLVDALSEDLLGASDDEILATHTPGAARVAADALRWGVRRASAKEAEARRGTGTHHPVSHPDPDRWEKKP